MNKMIVVAAAAVVLSTAAGFGGGTFLKSSQQAAAAVPEAAAAAALPPVIVEVGKMMVPVYKARHVTYVIADVRLAVRDKAAADKAEKEMAWVKSKALEAMLDFASKGRFDGQTIDSDALSERMSADIGRILGEKAVRDVLFEMLIKQDVARS